MQCSMASYSPDKLVLAWELMGKSQGCCLKLVYRWEGPQGISCLLLPLGKQSNTCAF